MIWLSKSPEIIRSIPSSSKAAFFDGRLNGKSKHLALGFFIGAFAEHIVGKRPVHVLSDDARTFLWSRDRSRRNNSRLFLKINRMLSHNFQISPILSRSAQKPINDSYDRARQNPIHDNGSRDDKHFRGQAVNQPLRFELYGGRCDAVGEAR